LALDVFGLAGMAASFGAHWIFSFISCVLEIFRQKKYVPTENKGIFLCVSKFSVGYAYTDSKFSFFLSGR